MYVYMYVCYVITCENDDERDAGALFPASSYPAARPLPSTIQVGY